MVIGTFIYYLMHVLLIRSAPLARQYKQCYYIASILLLHVNTPYIPAVVHRARGRATIIATTKLVLIGRAWEKSRCSSQ